jgi:hypothetical protein
VEIHGRDRLGSGHFGGITARSSLSSRFRGE